MTDAKPPAQFDWATELSDAQGHVTLSEQEAHEIGARLRSMGAENETLTLYKSLADEYGLSIFKDLKDLGDAGSDVQLLRMGYAAARLEIESLKSECDRFRAAYHEWSDKTEWARKSTTVNELGKHLADVLRERIEGLQAALKAAQPVAAPQPGAAYAALPEPITYQIAVLKACEHGDALVGWRVEPSRQSFDASMRPKRKLYTEGDMHDFADRTHALRASHGQAPAQAAPESFLEIPDVQDESGINSHYSRELVLECINAALAARGQAPAQAATQSELVATMLDALKHAQKVLNHNNLQLECAPINAAILAAKAAPAAVAGQSGYGPKATVKRSCSDCKACNSESYAVQGDSGHYVYCEHPSLPESKYIGDTNWNTPHWCPVAMPTTQSAPAAQEDKSSDE